MGMVGGDYAFFSVNPFDSKYFGDPSWKRENDTEENNRKAKEAYRALMTIQLHSQESEDYKTFAEEVKERAKEEFDYDFDANGEKVDMLFFSQ